MSNDVEINGDKTIKFSPQGISFILDLLATAPAPWNKTNPLIVDIMGQLRQQESGSGAATSGNTSDSTSRGHAGDRASGVLSMEDQ